MDHSPVHGVRPLAGRVALVTGASRGIGRGVAHELGMAGATVYITGRTRDHDRAVDELPGTIDDTSRLVEQAGGVGIAVCCDHTHDDEILTLAEVVRSRHGYLDILVNNVWGGYEDYDPTLFERPVWDQPIGRWDKMFETGVRAHYVTTHALLPMMIDRAALIVNISAGDDGRFLGDVQYDVAKSAVDRLGFALSRKLRKHGIAVVTVHPGLARTERMERYAAEEELSGAHSARFVGRGVVALASDAHAMERTGRVIKAADLGTLYRFRDIDESQPKPFRIPELD